MKTRLSRKAKQMGTTLMVVLILCTVFSAATLGYLSVIEHQNYLCARAQTWDTAMVVVEAGIDEGLQHLNYNTNNLAVDDWTQSGTTYTQSRTLANGNTYTVTIDNSDPFNPAIVSRATVVPPRLFSLNSQPALLAVMGVTVNAQDDVIKRAVRVKTTKSGLFTAALVARRSIDLKGNGIYSDSFDSSQPGFKSNPVGRYDQSVYSGDQGDIAANGGLANDYVSVQNANIYGKVHTGPNMPVTIGPEGAVGTHAWQANHTGFQPGYVLQDANFTFPDTTLPSTADALTPSSGTIVIASNNVASTPAVSTNVPSPIPAGGVTTNTATITVAVKPSPIPAGLVTNTTQTSTSFYPAAGTYVGSVSPYWHAGDWWFSYKKIIGYSYPNVTYSYSQWSTNVTYFTNFYENVLETGKKYYSTNLTGNTYVAGPDVMLVLPEGMTGAEHLTFKSGSNLEIYAGGTSITISGNQVINKNGYAGSLIVYAAPTVKDFVLNGNGEFTGVLVAPSVDLVLNGGGNSNNDFIGSLMVNSARFNGHFSFHYDEALKNAPQKGRFLITSWDEINPN